MSALLFEMGPGLAFRFEGLSELLAGPVRRSLAHFEVDELTPESRSSGPLVVSSGPVPHARPANTRVRLAEEGLEVWAAAGVTAFEAPGIAGWCQPAKRRGGIRVALPAPRPVERFVGLALAPLLFELAASEAWWGLHAAAVASGGHGVLIPGATGTGKSTIFRACHRAGLDVLSDDLVWLREDPLSPGSATVYPFPRRWAQDASLPAPTVAAAPLAAIVSPVIIDRRASSLEPIEPGETLGTLLEQSGLLGRGEAARGLFRSLTRLAGSVPGYRLLAGADRESVPRRLARLVASGRVPPGRTGPAAVEPR